MNIEKIKNQPERIEEIFVEAIIMPNGEILCVGRTIGWFKDLKIYLYIKE